MDNTLCLPRPEFVLMGCFKIDMRVVRGQISMNFDAPSMMSLGLRKNSLTPFYFCWQRLCVNGHLDLVSLITFLLLIVDDPTSTYKTWDWSCWVSLQQTDTEPSNNCQWWTQSKVRVDRGKREQTRHRTLAVFQTGRSKLESRLDILTGFNPKQTKTEVLPNRRFSHECDLIDPSTLCER